MLRIFVGYKVRRKEGPWSRWTIRPSRSWVRQIADLMLAYTTEDNQSVIDTGGTSRTVDASPDSGERTFNAAAGTGQGFGILVGSSTVAEDRDNYQLGAQLTTLDYVAPSISETAITGGYRLRISRQFDNNTAGDITIEETGLAVECVDSGSVHRNFLILRDLLTVTVPATGNATLRYDIDFLV